MDRLRDSIRYDFHVRDFGGELPFFPWHFPKKCIIELCGGGGTADTHASGACAPSGVRVQIPFSASWEGGPSSVRHRTRNPASGFSSRAGSNPVLSFYQQKGHELTRTRSSFSSRFRWRKKIELCFSLLFLLLEGHLLSGRSLLS